MNVRKKKPDVFRTVHVCVQRTAAGVRTKKNTIQKGLSASVIGAEEQQRQEGGKQNPAPAGQEEVKRLLAARKNRSRNPVHNVQREERKGQAVSSRDVSYTSTGGRYAAAGSSVQAGAAGPPGTKAAAAGETAARGRTAAGMTAANGTAAAGMTAANSTAAGTSAVNGAVSAAGAAGTTAAKAAGTAAETTAGAATAGTVIAVRVLAAAAKRTQEQIRQSLEASGAGKKQTPQQAEPAEERSAHKGGSQGMLLVLMGIPAAAVFFLTAVFLCLFLAVSSATQQPAWENIVETAEREEAASEQNIGGRKYKDWYGMDADWCAMFLSWCANECGYLDSGIMPKSASVAAMKSWYEQRGQYHTKESGYKPQPGDVIFFGNGRSHTGLVTESDHSLSTVTTIEGNTGASQTTPYHQGSRVKEKKYPLTYASIVGYGTPLYPQKTIEIPEPYGTEYSYMGWQTITSPSSKQYKLRQEAGMKFDADGFGKIGDRYVAACTLTFGQVGDYIDWELDNGTVIKTVIGDIKNQEDPGCNPWGHKNGLCVLEFVVDKNTWYGTGRYPTDFHGAWDGRTVRARNVGNYWKE